MTDIRTFILVHAQAKDLAIAAVSNLPIGTDPPFEIVIRPEKKIRKQAANAAMWAGTIRDIAEQAWCDGKQYSSEVWHEYMKAKFLPEDDDPDLDKLVKDVETWRKWEYTPDDRRILVGSTTRLTVRGFAQYMEQVHAFGAGLGVMFSARNNSSLST